MPSADDRVAGQKLLVDGRSTIWQVQAMEKAPRRKHSNKSISSKKGHKQNLVYGPFRLKFGTYREATFISGYCQVTLSHALLQSELHGQ